MNEKVRDFFKNNIGYFVVAFASSVYILTAFLTIDRTGKSLAQIIADGVMAFFLGLFINRIFDLQGMMSGDREERVRAIKEEHGNIVLRLSPYVDKLDAWCEKENEHNYIVQRTKILARVGLKYDDCFDKDGVSKNWRPNKENLKVKYLKKIEMRKIRAYFKAVNLKLTPLSAGELTSEGGKEQDPFYFGRTKQQYEAQASFGDIISKIGTACIFGYYGVSFIQNFDYARLIWTSLQVALFLVMGVIKMYQAYNFVVDEFRGRIVKKIDNLQKFDNYVKSLPSCEAERENLSAGQTEHKTEVNVNE